MEFWICQNSECVRCSTYHKVAVPIAEQLPRQTRIQNILKLLRWSVLQKEYWLKAGAQPEVFRAEKPKYRHNQGAFFQNQSTSFWFSKKKKTTPSCLPVSVDQYMWISLNILSNACIIFWLCQGSEYTWSPYMFGRLLKMRWVLDRSEFWTWHSFICKGYTEFSICLNMTQYASVTTEYVSMS